MRLAVDLCIVNADTVLLGHRIARVGFDTWAFPGGRVEAGESVIEAAKREVCEELGAGLKYALSGRVLAVRECSFPPEYVPHLTIVLEAVYVSGELALMEPHKHGEWRWWPLDKLPERLFSNADEVVSAYRNGEAILISHRLDRLLGSGIGR